MHPIQIAEKYFLPRWVLGLGIRKLLKIRLQELSKSSAHPNFKQKFLDELKNSPLALETQAANAQHYEVPSAFFDLALGKRHKYSSCYWDSSVKTLDEAEERMLWLVVNKAGLKDGMRVLDLGCGWGSLSLFICEFFPNCKVTGLSNSNSQRQWILNRAKQKSFSNLEIMTGDINTIEMSRQFDRVFSIEMFEHLRNYQKLFKKIRSWLADDGQMFVHIFCHRQTPYLFETQGEGNWMGRYFFTGGIMPSFELFEAFNEDLVVKEKMFLNGRHYEKTAFAWEENMIKHQGEVLQIFSEVYGKTEAVRWFNRWRIFFLACAYCFGFSGGKEWGVGHYLFEPAKP